MRKQRLLSQRKKVRSVPLPCCFVLLLFLPSFAGTPPELDSLLQSDYQLTLSTVSDFPLTGYASLSFEEGGGLFRLYDRSQVEKLQTGQTYALTAGRLPGHYTPKVGYRTPSYSAIIAMASTDGAVITTAANYSASHLPPLGIGLLVVLLALLGYGAFRLLRRVIYKLK